MSIDAMRYTLTYSRVNRCIATLMRALQCHPEWNRTRVQYVRLAVRHLNTWRRNPYDWRLQYAIIALRLANNPLVMP